MAFKRVLLMGILVAGCASQAAFHEAALSPEQIIVLAAQTAPQPVSATVALEVHMVGSQNDTVFLNSEADYRDQRNVSVEISPAARMNVEALFGGDLSKAAVGKHILVKAPARRVTVWFFDSNGRRSDKYYYQTHIMVSDPAQIRII